MVVFHVVGADLELVEHVEELLSGDLHVGVVGAHGGFEHVFVVLPRGDHARADLTHDVVGGVGDLLGHDKAILGSPTLLPVLSIE